MIRFELQRIVAAAVSQLVISGQIPSADYGAAEIVDTKQPEHGDYACNFALTAAKKAGKTPREVGELLRSALLSEAPSVFSEIEVAGPGFVNFRLNPSWIVGFVTEILERGDELASTRATNRLPDAPAPQRINLEFVSVNPNGPITIGSGRGAAYGSTLANVLVAAGNEVHREYYINDGVNSEQMRQFALSVYGIAKALLTKMPLPELAYRGEYVFNVAEDAFRDSIKSTIVRDLSLSDENAWEALKSFVSTDSSAPVICKFLVAEADDQEGAVGIFQSISQKMMLARQNSDLAAFGVVFDTWFSEQSLHDAGKVEECIQHLVHNGAADEQPYRTKLKLAKGGKIEEVEKEPQGDGTQEDEEGSSQGDGTTLWLRSTKFGDDMDRVLKRRDGRLTYIASDVAYHKNKFERPKVADRLITILGPDHHGYIGRLQAVLAAQLLVPNSARAETELTEIDTKLYATPEERDACQAALAEAREKLEVQIYQLVRFLKDGKPAPMRKRDGNIYALIDLIDEIGKKVKPNESQAEQRKVGKDVARFFYLMRSHDTTFDFDLDLAEKQSDENPVFYVQYAHARICSILAKAGDIAPTFRAELLTHPKELELIKKIADLPWEVQRCATDYGVHRLTTYAIELARTFHHFYDACRVIQEEQPELTEARKSLCQATRQALQATFKLLGIEAPERMDRES